MRATTAVACTCTTPWHQVWHRASLSVAASAVARILRGHAEDPMAAYAGMSEDPMPQVRRVLRQLGWDPGEFNEAVEARTSQRFAFFSGLTVEPEPEPARHSRRSGAVRRR